MVNSNRKAPPHSLSRVGRGSAALACLLLFGTFLDCATPDGAVSPGRVGRVQRPIDMDPEFAEKLGREALAKIGYLQIIHLARQAGWVTRKAIRRPIAGDRSFLSMDVAQVAAGSEFIEVFSAYAVAAGVTSQADTTLPGPLDLVAIGILVIGLIDAGLLAGILLETLAEATSDVTSNPPLSPIATTEPTATPAPTTSPLPTVNVPPVALTLTRRYPNQTCEDEELNRLGDEMDLLCKSGYAAACNINADRMKKIPCSLILLSLQQRQACLTARWRVQNQCFGGKPDDGHKEQIDITEKGINRCEALKLINCAKGHPMAGK